MKKGLLASPFFNAWASVLFTTERSPLLHPNGPDPRFPTWETIQGFRLLHAERQSPEFDTGSPQKCLSGFRNSASLATDDQCYPSGMCGRYRLRNADNPRLAKAVGARDYELLLKLDRQADRFNVAPTQFCPVFLQPTAEAETTSGSFRWGLIPPWAKDLKSAYSTINARSETAATLRTFAKPFAERHCLIPASGWYEWRNMEDGKQPYSLELPGGEPFLFAGLWQAWKPKDGDIVNSFTILTMDANRHIRALHDRMPVIVPQSRWQDWLHTRGTPESSALLKTILAENEGISPEIHPVSKKMSNARNEGAEAAAVLPMNEALELDSRAKVLDAIESFTASTGPPTVYQIAEAAGLGADRARDVIEDLEEHERVKSHPSPHEDHDDEKVWTLAGVMPPDQVPPLNPL